MTQYLSTLEILLAHPLVDPSAKSSEALLNAYHNGHLPAFYLILKDLRVDAAADENNLLRMVALAGQTDLVLALLSNEKVFVNALSPNRLTRPPYRSAKALSRLLLPVLPPRDTPRLSKRC